jgi:hypothetical protein
MSHKKPECYNRRINDKLLRKYLSVAAKYDSANDFRKGDNAVYVECCKYGILKEITKRMKKNKVVSMTDSELLRYYSKRHYSDGPREWTVYLEIRKRGLLSEANAIKERVKAREKRSGVKVVEKNGWTVYR